MSALAPTATAVAFDEDRWSYADLATATVTASAALEGLGISRGSQIALLATNSPAWLQVAFGAMRLGACVNAFNTWVRAYDLDHLLEASAAEVLVMVDSVGSTSLLDQLKELVPEAWEAAPGGWRSPRYPSLRYLIVLDASEKQPPGALSWARLVDQSPGGQQGGFAVNDRSDGDDVAMVLYTSGSTQNPKAVPMIHQAMIENGFAIGERLGLCGDDRIWLGSPLFWSFGIANATMAALTHGACLVLQERFEPVVAAATLAANACTAAYLLPSMVDALIRSGVDAEIRQIEELRTGITIGRPDEIARVIEKLDIPEICNVYGSTETYGNCCVTPRSLPAGVRMTTQGEPLPGVELRIVDPDSGKVVTTGVEGEIQVRGRIMPGYVGSPASTSSVMTPDGWFRTGDTGILRPDGRLRFVARHSEVIKTSGINVSPAEIEAFLSRHPSISDVAVVGIPHEAKGEVPVAFIATSDTNLTEAVLFDFCRGAIASYKIPTRILVVDRLPQTTTGKLARKDLLSLAKDAVNAQEHAAKATR
jgi:fatty-acyl-CoA synthase